MSKEKKGVSRRRFVGTTAAATAGFTILPSNVVSGMGHIAPSDKLNVAAVGIGGMGASNLRNIKDQNIVALCDVDWKYAEDTFKKYPDAKQYWDWRKMYDEMADQIDGVIVATADHTHALLWLSVMWTISTLKKPSRNIPMPSSTGIGERCMMKWPIRLMV